MKYSERVALEMMKRPKALAIGASIAGFLLIIGIGAVAFITLATGSHNWDLGLAPQKSSDELAKVQKAVDTVTNEAILDTHVENANTSGTPFGHSVRVSVLVDQDRIESRASPELQTLAEQLTKAIQDSGLK